MNLHSGHHVFQYKARCGYLHMGVPPTSQNDRRSNSDVSDVSLCCSHLHGFVLVGGHSWDILTTVVNHLATLEFLPRSGNEKKGSGQHNMQQAEMRFPQSLHTADVLDGCRSGPCVDTINLNMMAIWGMESNENHNPHFGRPRSLYVGS